MTFFKNTIITLFFMLINVCFLHAIDERLEQTLTHESSKKLAYQDPKFNNVGFIPGRLFGGTTAVYCGDRIVLTTAHRFLDFHAYYHFFPFSYSTKQTKTSEEIEVFFEINGKRVSYQVEKFDVEQHYDLAILKLKKPVEGLDGFELDFTFGNEEKTYEFDDTKSYSDQPHRLMYIGYKLGFKSDSNKDSYAQRLVSQSLCDRICDSEGTRVLRTMPHRALFTNNHDSVVLKEQKAFPYETGYNDRMSSGFAIRDGKIIGIIRKSDFPPVNLINYGAFIIKYCTNYFVSFLNYRILLFWHYALPTFNLDSPIIGTAGVSIPLGICEDWIKQKKAEFDQIEY